jgi:hypothetical protein
MNIQDQQRLYLQTIFDYFREKAEWPTYPLSLHFLDEAASGGKKVIQGIRLNARKELLMKPLKDQATLATLDLTASLTKSNGALPIAYPLLRVEINKKPERANERFEPRTFWSSGHGAAARASRLPHQLLDDC